MYELNRLLTSMQDFMSSGGDVLWVILLLTALLWALIVERIWFFRYQHPRQLETVIAAWRERRDKRSWYSTRIREAWISELEVELNRFIPLLKTVIAVLPLVGLLGTVTGMVQVFDVLSVMGTGNPRAMASGVSAATIPTMAGMVAALSGLYFSVRLERQALTRSQVVADRISFFDETANA